MSHPHVSSRGKTLCYKWEENEAELIKCILPCVRIKETESQWGRLISIRPLKLMSSSWIKSFSTKAQASIFSLNFAVPFMIKRLWHVTSYALRLLWHHVITQNQITPMTDGWLENAHVVVPCVFTRLTQFNLKSRGFVLCFPSHKCFLYKVSHKNKMF